METLSGFSFSTLLLCAVVIALSGLVHGTLGLGFPLVATPLLALSMDVRSAILVTLLPTVSVNIVSIVYGGGWRYSIGRYWPLGVYAFLGSVFGTSLLIVSNPAPFKLLLALLILVFLGSSRLGALKMPWVSAHLGWSMFVFGTVAGVASGTTNVMVPVLIVYALELGLGATAMVQVFNLCFLAGKLAQIATFTGAGSLGAGFLASTAPLAGVALFALWAGMVIRRRVPTAIYRVWMKRVLFVVAVVLILQYLAGT